MVLRKLFVEQLQKILLLRRLYVLKIKKIKDGGALGGTPPLKGDDGVPAVCDTGTPFGDCRADGTLR
jgi:hypothetical protein